MLRPPRVCNRNRTFLLKKSLKLADACWDCDIPVCFHICETNWSCTWQSDDGTICHCKCTDKDLLHGLDLEDTIYIHHVLFS